MAEPVKEAEVVAEDNEDVASDSALADTDTATADAGTAEDAEEAEGAAEAPAEEEAPPSVEVEGTASAHGGDVDRSAHDAKPCFALQQVHNIVLMNISGADLCSFQHRQNDHVYLCIPK